MQMNNELKNKEGYDIFSKLIAPVSVEEFFSEYWGKKVLYIPRSDSNYYSDILSFNTVDEYLSRSDLRYPYIRMVQNGRELPLNSYAYDSVFGENLFQGNLDLDKLFNLYNNGATMCMQLQHLAIPSLGNFTNKIERFFEFRTQSTLFLTPSNSQGFTVHYDSHDFFIFQIYGSKTWKIYGNEESFPLPRKKVFDSDVVMNSKPVFQPLIKPGDCLYVPRGVYHEALTENNETALQISLGVFPFHWIDVMQKMIEDLSEKHEVLRRNVLTPINPTQTYKDFKEILEILEKYGNPLSVTQEMKKMSLSKQLKDCKGRLTDTEKLKNLNLYTKIKKRDIKVTIENNQDAIIIFYYDKELILPIELKSDIEDILTCDKITVNEISSLLEDEDKIALATAFVKEGLFTIIS